MSEQYFIYHKSGEAHVVREPEYSKLLKKGDYFKTPLEAEEAKKEDLRLIAEEEKARLKAADDLNQGNK